MRGLTCEVCDREDPDDVFHSYPMHRSCAPKRWVKDAAALTEFTARFRIWWQSAPRWKKERNT